MNSWIYLLPASTISAALDLGKFVCLSIDGYKILDKVIYSY